MAEMDRLNALAVTRKTKPGRYADGGGLYLQVTETGAKSWLFRYKIDGKARSMGLGAVHAVPLKDARLRADEARRIKAAGLDPLSERDRLASAQRAEAARAMTFEQCAEAYISSHEASWKNAKHRQQWRNTLATYVYPLLGALPVQAVDVPLVLKVLQPIWLEKAETAGRVRGRIEVILDWARVNRHRDGENPARLRGNLDHALPDQKKRQKVNHHAALPYDALPAFVTDVRAEEATTALACEFLLLTASRTSETLNSCWSEIDEKNAVWTIPGAKMKGGREHCVPLSTSALALLNRAKLLKRGENPYVFPGRNHNKPLSNMAVLALLRRMKRTDITAHGFRSTFKDWASECTNAPNEVSEMALAHAVGSKVEAAYRRGTLFEKRKALMEAWARHCEGRGNGAQIIDLARRRA